MPAIPAPPAGWELIVLGSAVLALSLAALFHVLIRHQDHRAAGFWVALILFSPGLGTFLYALLGINRMRRKALHYRGGPAAWREPAPSCPLSTRAAGRSCESDCALAATLDRISRFNFAAGNRVEPLQNGDAALPAMLDAIRDARTSISLCSYIFEARGVGAEFVTELAAARNRGVEVRVIVDDAGTRYAWPPVTRELRRLGVPVHRFMPNRLVMRLLTLNLRNHKKILVVDGTVAFTGLAAVDNKAKGLSMADNLRVNDARDGFGRIFASCFSSTDTRISKSSRLSLRSALASALLVSMRSGPT
jgi:cardiolipin synthase